MSNDNNSGARVLACLEELDKQEELLAQNPNSKKMAPLAMLKMFYNYTDSNHHLQQQDILRLLKREYNVYISPHTIKPNIDILIEAGFCISHQRDGYFLDESSRILDDDELSFLLDKILYSTEITHDVAQRLSTAIVKLMSISGFWQADYKWQLAKTNFADGVNVLHNRDYISEAIKNGCGIIFNSIKVDASQKIELKKIKKERVEAEPLQIFNSQGFEWVEVCERSQNGKKERKYYRLDKITDVRLDKTKSYRGGTLHRFYRMTPKYARGGETKAVFFRISRDMISEALDFFNGDFVVKHETSKDAIIEACVDENDAIEWAMRFGNAVEILKPDDMRDKMKSLVSQMSSTYQNDKLPNVDYTPSIKINPFRRNVRVRLNDRHHFERQQAKEKYYEKKRK